MMRRPGPLPHGARGGPGAAGARGPAGAAAQQADGRWRGCRRPRRARSRSARPRAQTPMARPCRLAGCRCKDLNRAPALSAPTDGRCHALAAAGAAPRRSPWAGPCCNVVHMHMWETSLCHQPPRLGRSAHARPPMGRPRQACGCCARRCWRRSRASGPATRSRSRSRAATSAARARRPRTCCAARRRARRAAPARPLPGLCLAASGCVGAAECAEKRRQHRMCSTPVACGCVVMGGRRQRSPAGQGP